MTKENKRELWSWVFTIGAAIVFAFLILTFVFRFHFISGTSMQPTLENNEVVFVDKLSYRFSEPKRGDVVNCHYPEEDGSATRENFSKRIIGLPGETIEIKDSVVYINGQAGEDHWMGDHRVGDMAEQRIGDGDYFVMGDNRSVSLDSRSVGQIPRSFIKGKIRFVLFPFNKIRIIR